MDMRVELEKIRGYVNGTIGRIRGYEIGKREDKRIRG